LPASFSLSNLTVVPSEAEPDEAVTVTVEVANTGGMAGDYSLVLQIDGAELETKNVAVNAGDVATVSFTVNREEPGTYTVSVNGITASYDVAKPAPAPEPEPAPAPTKAATTATTPSEPAVPTSPAPEPLPPESESGTNWILIGVLAAIAAVLIAYIIYKFVNRRD